MPSFLSGASASPTGLKITAKVLPLIADAEADEQYIPGSDPEETSRLIRRHIMEQYDNLIVVTLRGSPVFRVSYGEALRCTMRNIYTTGRFLAEGL